MSVMIAPNEPDSAPGRFADRRQIPRRPHGSRSRDPSGTSHAVERAECRGRANRRRHVRVARPLQIGGGRTFVLMSALVQKAGVLGLHPPCGLERGTTVLVTIGALPDL